MSAQSSLSPAAAAAAAHPSDVALQFADATSEGSGGGGVRVGAGRRRNAEEMMDDVDMVEGSPVVRARQGSGDANMDVSDPESEVETSTPV